MSSNTNTCVVWGLEVRMSVGLGRACAPLPVPIGYHQDGGLPIRKQVARIFRLNLVLLRAISQLLRKKILAELGMSLPIFLLKLHIASLWGLQIRKEASGGSNH